MFQRVHTQVILFCAKIWISRVSELLENDFFEKKTEIKEDFEDAIEEVKCFFFLQSCAYEK